MSLSGQAMSRGCHSIARVRETANLSAQPLRHGICCYYEYVQIKIAQSFGRASNETSHHDGARMRHVVLRGRSGARSVERTKSASTHDLSGYRVCLVRGVHLRRHGRFVKNNQGKKYPAVSCECPIIVGDNVADLNGGNMKGSCTSSDPNLVYSTFEFSDSFPQLITGTWQDAPSVMQVCPSQDSFSQCWNWACTRDGTQNGVALAACTCPMEQTSNSFVTQAGQGDSSACAESAGWRTTLLQSKFDAHGQRPLSDRALAALLWVGDFP